MDPRKWFVENDQIRFPVRIGPSWARLGASGRFVNRPCGPSLQLADDLVISLAEFNEAGGLTSSIRMHSSRPHPEGFLELLTGTILADTQSLVRIHGTTDQYQVHYSTGSEARARTVRRFPAVRRLPPEQDRSHVPRTVH
jgi:hypothetical protein